MSEKHKELWKSSSYREKQLRLRRTTEYSKRLSRALREAWSDPSRRNKQSEVMKGLWRDRDYQKAVVKGISSRNSELERTVSDVVAQLGFSRVEKPFIFCSECRHADGCGQKIGFKPDMRLRELPGEIYEVEGGYFVRDPRKLDLLRRKQECYRRHGWRLIIVTYPRFAYVFRQAFPEALVETLSEMLLRLGGSTSADARASTLERYPRLSIGVLRK